MPELYQSGFYNTGTASIAQGQTVVTGQGTAWRGIVRPADDFGKHVGHPIPIASVDSDTQITLAYPWPGPTQVAASYRITFTPYEVTYRQALQEIGKLLVSGNVSALAGLDLAADKLPYATGPGTMALTGLSPFMRTLLDDANASEAVSTLAPMFGWGANNANVGVPSDNLDILRINGVYRATATTIGVPSASGVWQVAHMGQAANYAVQIGYQITSIGVGKMAKRMLHNNVWYPWIDHSPPEGGSNANGDYVRFADGTQICRHSLPPVTTQYSTGGLFVSGDQVWTFPASFSSPPVSSAQVRRVSSGTSSPWYGGAVNAFSSSTSTFRAWSTQSTVQSEALVVAIGRWY